MKAFLPFLTSLLFSVSAIATQEIINAPVSKLFVPKGFDNNDNVELLVKGTFPDSCYSRNSFSVEVKEERINVQITALRTQESECEKIEIPYLENVTVGSLQAGSYQITVNGVLEAELEVTESNSTSVDEHLYGMILYVELGFTGGVTGDFFLIGQTMDCLSLDRVETISNGKDTLSVLPIMKKKAEDCRGKRKSFTVPVKFNIKGFSTDEILLFVRTMDGKSIHSLIDR